MAASPRKPAVLIVGGLGYIGRFLALYIHENDLASEVRLVDKVLPPLAWLAPEFAEACSNDKFVQADATRPRTTSPSSAEPVLLTTLESLERIFTPKSAPQYDYVFNCGGETRYSQEDEVYRLRNVELSLNLARECASRNVKAYVELSTGMVYANPKSSLVEKGGCTESAALKPWIKVAKHHLDSENGVVKVSAEKGLAYVVLRLAHVYGEYDVGYLSRGLCLARVYQEIEQPMKFLYGKDLRRHTVHVKDAVVAIWKAATWCAATPVPFAGTGKVDEKSVESRIFNVADEGDTTQNTLSEIFASIFSIETGFQNALVNTFAKLNIDTVVDDVNDDALQPWAELLEEEEITRPGPISPFMEKELLKDFDLALDSRKAREVLGWKCEERTARMSKELVVEVVESYKRMKWWP